MRREWIANKWDNGRVGLLSFCVVFRKGFHCTGVALFRFVWSFVRGFTVQLSQATDSALFDAAFPPQMVTQADCTTDREH